MARPKNLKAREKILDAAHELIFGRGYRGVSMDDVAARARIKKANLFHYYPSKESLGLAVLEQAARRDRERILSRFSAGADPVRTVEGMFLDYARGMEEHGCTRGCFVGNLAQEISDQHEDMRRAVSEHFVFWVGQLAGFLERHKEERYFCKDMDCRQSAQALVALLEGATLMSKASRRPEALKDARCMASIYLKSLAWEK